MDYAFGKVEGNHRGTTGESAVTNVGNSVGKSYRLDNGAIFKSVIPYACNGVLDAVNGNFVVDYDIGMSAVRTIVGFKACDGNGEIAFVNF